MSIRLSKKHGVNPSLIKCPICKKEYGIALFGRLKGDEEAPKTVEGDLCDECKQKYVTVIEVSRDDKGLYKTGRCIYVPKENVKKECPDNIAYMIDTDFKNLIEDGTNNA